LPRLDNSDDYLMIPYIELKKKPTKNIIVWSGPIYYIETVPDYNQVTVEDEAPGWRAWAFGAFGSKLNKLAEIKNETGPEYKW
jgi:hypothetical protein